MKHILISILIFLALLFPQNLPEPVPPVTTISTSELIKQVDCVKEIFQMYRKTSKKTIQ